LAVAGGIVGQRQHSEKTVTAKAKAKVPLVARQQVQIELEGGWRCAQHAQSVCRWHG